MRSVAYINILPLLSSPLSQYLFSDIFPPISPRIHLLSSLVSQRCLDIEMNRTNQDLWYERVREKCVLVCVFLCVCERERERERGGEGEWSESNM